MVRWKKLLILIWIGLMSFFSINAITPGEKIDNVTLGDYNDQKHSLSGFKDKAAIVLVFISTRCPVSNAYNARLNQLYKDYSAKNVAFLGINANRSEDVKKIKAHAEKQGFKFIILRDENNVVADKLGAKVTPEAYVFSTDLTLLYHGHIDDSQREAQVKKTGLRDALDEAVAGKEISDKSTKPFGCSIKRARD